MEGFFNKANQKLLELATALDPTAGYGPSKLTRRQLLDVMEKLWAKNAGVQHEVSRQIRTGCPLGIIVDTMWRMGTESPDEAFIVTSKDPGVLASFVLVGEATRQGRSMGSSSNEQNLALAKLLLKPPCKMTKTLYHGRQITHIEQFGHWLAAAKRPERAPPSAHKGPGAQRMSSAAWLAASDTGSDTEEQSPDE